jgi:hypothetical protein
LEAVMPSNPVRSQKLRLLVLTLIAGLIGSCVDSSAPNPPSTAARTGIDAAIQASPTHGIDAEFTRLAKQVPGFGGMYYDRSGRLNIYVTRAQGGAAARSADVTGRLRTFGGAAVQRRLRSAAVTIREAKYDFAQLQSWKARLSRVFTVKGVVYTDIDEEANRIGLALTPAASQAAVERIINSANVPLGAVSFRRMPAIRQLKTLQERFRPVPGGAQIVFPAEGGQLFVCTVGFNALLPEQLRNTYFVTASHCSDTQGGNQGTPYYQPFPGSSPGTNRIAFEFKDPQYGNPGGLCYVDFRCRLSDALLAKYPRPLDGSWTQIARTTFGLQRIGSIIVNPNNPRWNIVGRFDFPFLGETAHKVGRTSGWTRGPVVATCVDVLAGGTDIIELCQDIVFAGSRPGDSGAAVFERNSLNSSDVFLIGILWGGGTNEFGAPIFVLSSMENIQFELGRLLVAEGEF